MSSPPLDRYRKQMLFAGLGEEGQRRLLDATVVIVGCGATGSMLAMLLVRAGVGTLRLIDRDFVESSNLQRQVLFEEADIVEALPKAEAAARALRRANSAIVVEPVVADFNAGNALHLLRDATVILDGTDNFTTRYLLNDACLALSLPWVYSGVVAAYGMTATFVPKGATLPGDRAPTGCLRCLLGEIPAPGTTPTCDTAGVIGPAVSLVASIAAAEAMKLMTGGGELNRGLLHVDPWTHEYELLGAGERLPSCPACGRRRFDFLDATAGTTSATLCGRNAVQVAVSGAPLLELARVEAQLRPVADALQRNDYLLRARIDGYQFTLFPDSRAIIQGTDDEELARSLYARYIGS